MLIGISSAYAVSLVITTDTATNEVGYRLDRRNGLLFRIYFCLLEY